MKDWTGNNNSIWKTLGASNHTYKERQSEDFYATDGIAIDKLLKVAHPPLRVRMVPLHQKAQRLLVKTVLLAFVGMVVK